MLVKEIMSKPVYTIDKNKTAKDAGRLMGKSRRGFLIILDKNKPIGVLSDSDLIDKVIAQNTRAGQIKVKEIMSMPFVSVDANDDISDAVKKMKKSNIHRLPVISKNKLVGVLSLTDIARVSPEMIYLLEYRLKMKEEPVQIREKRTSGICDSCGDFFDDLTNTDGQWLCEDCREELEE